MANKQYGVQVDSKTKGISAKSASAAKDDAVKGKKRFMIDGKGVYAKSRDEAMKAAKHLSDVKTKRAMPPKKK